MPTTRTARPAGGSSRRCRCQRRRNLVGRHRAAEPPLEPPGTRSGSPRCGSPDRRSSRSTIPWRTRPCRLADDDRAGGAQAGHAGGVVRRHEALEDAASASRRGAARAEDVLDGDRHPGERAERAAALRSRSIRLAAAARAPSSSTCRKAPIAGSTRGDAGPGAPRPPRRRSRSPAAIRSRADARTPVAPRSRARSPRSSDHPRTFEQPVIGLRGVGERLVARQAGRGRRPRAARRDSPPACEVGSTALVSSRVELLDVSRGWR